jgi:hypothetical protein
MSHPVENDLRNGALPIRELAARFIIDRLCEAVERAIIGCVIAPQLERPRRRVRLARKGNRRVYAERVLPIDITQ